MRPTILAVAALLAPALCAGASGDGFAKIPAGSYTDGHSTIHIDAFELAVHPVTNAEYREFVQATGHAAPSALGTGAHSSRMGELSGNLRQPVRS